MIAVAVKSDLRAKILQRNQSHEGARMGVAVKAAKRVVLGAMTVRRAVIAAARRTAVVLGAVPGAAHGAARRAVLRATIEVVLGAEKRVVLGAEIRVVLGAVIAVVQENVRRVVLGAMIEVALAAGTRVVPAAETRVVPVAGTGVVPGAGSRAAVGAESRVAVGAEVQVREAVQDGVPAVADAPTVAEARAVAVGAVPVLEEVVEARNRIRRSGASCLYVALVEKEVLVLSGIQSSRSFAASGKCWETKCATVVKIALERLACSSTLKVA